MLTNEQYGSPAPGIKVASAPVNPSRSNVLVVIFGSKPLFGVIAAFWR
jgi:hypothetical protein